jgi:hypothetical protein
MEEKYPTTKLMMDTTEELQPKRNGRGYLGMSSIGEKCEAKSWLDFRQASSQKFSAKTLYCFEDGHYSEEITAARLKQIPSIKLRTVGEDGNYQIGYKDHGGHFAGHIDGIISGLVQDPESEYVWEHKCTSPLKFNALEKHIEKHGEGKALKKWNETYFVQAQMYMHYSKIHQHFMTVATSGSREYLELITLYDKETALKFIAKAEDIIISDNMPNRIASGPIIPCKYCNHLAICHERKLPYPNCRVCVHSEAVVEETDGAKWFCHEYENSLSAVEQLRGCMRHLYNPSAIQHFATQFDCDGESVTYERKENHSIFVNGLRDGEYTSIELYLETNSGYL